MATTAVAFDVFWGTNPVLQIATNNTCIQKATGTYTGDPPASIQYQVEDFQSPPTIHQAYAAMTSFTASGGVWSGVMSLPTNLKQYLQIQIKEPVSGVNSTSGALSVGKNFIIVGQSLVEQFISESDTFNSPTAALTCGASFFVQNDVEFNALNGGLGAPSSPYNWVAAHNGEGQRTLASALSDKINVSVGLIDMGTGGTPLLKAAAAASTPLQYLMSQEGNDANWPTEGILSLLQTALQNACHGNVGGPDASGIIFLGNEADAIGFSSREEIADGLILLYDKIRAMLGTNRSPAEFPMFITELGKFGSAVARTQEVAEGEKLAITKFSRKYPGVFIDGGSRYDQLIANSGVHLTPDAYAEVARRLAMSMGNYYDPATAGPPGAGPYVESGYFTSSEVVFSINLNGHSGLKVDNSGAAITGFAVSATPDFASPLTYTGAVLDPTAETVTITGFGSGLSGPLYGKFWSTADPQSPTDNFVRTTNSPPGSTLGIPLQRRHAVVLMPMA